MRWKLLGIDFHWRWRTGQTWLVNPDGNHMISHHGFYSLEWARGASFASIQEYRMRRKAQP
jgi:hypothetical protein